MKHLFTTALAVSATLCSVGLAAAQMSDDKMGSMSATGHTFKLDAQNGSGETGSAVLSQTPAGLVVKVTMTGSTGDQPIHIHKGTCAKLDPAPAYPLTTVMDGKSTTTLKDVKLSVLTSGTYAINVHKSTTDLKDYVACGDLKIMKSMRRVPVTMMTK